MASDHLVSGAPQISGASGLVSFTLGLTGPCLSLDTACSSQLVTAHLASTALLSDECLNVITAGVGLLGPKFTRAFATSGMLSALGRCNTFDAKADGYCRGEGCATILLSASEMMPARCICAGTRV